MALTLFGTVIGILYQNAVPVFADIDPLSGNLDVNDVAAKITERIAQTRRRGRSIGIEHRRTDSPSAGGWLKTVTTNLCLNHLSRHRRRWRLFSELARDDGDDHDDGGAAGTAVVDSLVSSPPVDLAQAERSARLETALEALPDHQRVPIVLFHFEGMSYDVIAASLGISLGKLKTDMRRGRLALRRALDGVA